MRGPIIDTTKSVRPITMEQAYGDVETTGDGWTIGIDCPVDGKSVSPCGPFDTYEAAMDAIKRGEY